MVYTKLFRSILISFALYVVAFPSPVFANSNYLHIHQYIADPSHTKQSKYQFLLNQYQQLEQDTSENYKAAIITQLVLASARLANSELYQQWSNELDSLLIPPKSRNALEQLRAKADIELHYFQSDYLGLIEQGESFLKQQQINLVQAKLNFEHEQLFFTRLDVAQITNMLGVAYFFTGNYKQAQSNFLSALTQYEQLEETRGQTDILNNLSLISWAQKNYQEAINYLEKAKILSQEIGNISGVLSSLTNQGIYYHELTQFDNAIHHFNQVMQHESINEYPKLAISALIAMSETLSQVGELTQSKIAIESAQTISHSLADSLYQTRTNLALAHLYLAETRFQDALSLFEQVKREYQSRQLIKEEADVTLAISLAYKGMGDFQQSLANYEQYHKLSTDLLAKAQDVSINQLKKQHQLAMRDNTIKLLQQENHLKNAEIVSQQDQQLLVIVVAVATGIMFMLGYNWYFTRKESVRLRQKNQIIERNEQQLLLLSFAFKNTSDGVWITNTDGIIEVVNNAFVKLTHHLKSEVVGRPVRLAPVKGQDEQLMKRIFNQAKVDGSWRGELYDQRASGMIYPIELEIEAINNEDGVTTNYLGVFRDITEQKEAEAQLTKLATHHKVTQLPNRTLFQELLNQSCLNASANGVHPTVIYLEFTNFKQINDMYGHQSGEQLLVEVANRIKGVIQDKDVLAHFNNDEFCLLAKLKTPKRGGAKIAQKLLSALETPFDVNNSPFKVNVAIGITFYPNDADNADELIRKAMIAMLDVKTTQKHHYRFYEQHMNDEVTLQLEREQRLLNAINNQYFDFYYQPIVDVNTQDVVAAEALIRWQEPDGTLIPPDAFIPLAEQCGIIDQIDRIAIDSVLKQKALWQQNGIELSMLSINLSAKLFSQPQTLITLLQAKLSQYQVSAKGINIEITESMLLSNLQEAIQTMHELKSLDFSLSLDDFGTGYSSLSYLKLFPIDTLKIDRSFIKGIHESEVDESIVRAIITMAKTLSLKVVAEGVELSEHQQILAKTKCDYFQGYYESKPLPVPAFEAHLTLKKRHAKLSV
ncbi:EAL domain-containing protein [Thalassotalea fusca]